MDCIICEWKIGFKLGDHLLRPATVVISSGPAEEESEESDDNEAEPKDGTESATEKPNEED